MTCKFLLMSTMHDGVQNLSLCVLYSSDGSSSLLHDSHRVAFDMIFGAKPAWGNIVPPRAEVPPLQPMQPATPPPQEQLHVGRQPPPPPALIPPQTAAAEMSTQTIASATAEVGAQPITSVEASTQRVNRRPLPRSRPLEVLTATAVVTTAVAPTPKRRLPHPPQDQAQSV